MLLKGHDMKIKDVAHACGFVGNYFCRLFRKNTERSPPSIAASITAS